MYPVLSEVRWRALRAMFEVHGVPFALMSVAVAVNAETIRSRARYHKWAREAADAGGMASADAAARQAVDEAALEELTGLIDRPGDFAEFLTKQVAGVARAAEKGRLDKARIEAIWSMIRLVEKAQEIARETAQDQQKRSDEQLAEYLQRIDERVVELAEHHARRLVAAQSAAA